MRRKTDLKRQTIVDAATFVFLNKGYTASTMSDIALRAGGSKATLYSYFSSKEALFITVMNAMAEDSMLKAYARLIPGMDLAATLQDFGEHFLGIILSPDLLALRSVVIGEGMHSEIRKLYSENGPCLGWTRLAHFLEGEMERGHLRKAPPWKAAMHLSALIESEYQDILVAGSDWTGSKAESGRRVADAVAIFLAGYAPERKAVTPAS